MDLETIPVGVAKASEILLKSHRIAAVCNANEQGSAIDAIAKSGNGLDDNSFEVLVDPTFFHVPAQGLLELQFFAFAFENHFLKRDGDLDIGRASCRERVCQYV